MPPLADGQLFGPEGLGTSFKIIAVLSALSLLPAVILTVTSFVRTIVVLSFIRQGIGSQETPPNQVLIGLAMFLTLFVMTPVMNEIKAQGVDPYLEGKLTEVQALEKALVPLRSFMLRHTRAEVAWAAVGTAIGAYEAAVRYAKERVQFGKPIGAHQLIQELLVKCLGSITASPSAIALDLVVLAAMTIVAAVVIRTRQQVSRPEAVVLLLGYIAFLSTLALV